jgi:hypothetical protein
LWSINNYNSMMGIIAGLNMGAVSRLRHTFAGLTPGFSKVRGREEEREEKGEGERAEGGRQGRP